MKNKLQESVETNLEITVPNATVEEAAKRMEVGNVGVLPVLEGTRLVGLVTDRDIVVRTLAQGLDPKTTKIKDIMTKEVVTCSIDQSLDEAGRLMGENKIRRLMVIDKNGDFMGVISLGDLAEGAPDKKFVGEVLKKISSGH